MREYEVTKNTLAIVPIGETKSKIYEKDCNFIIEDTPNNIMDESCKYYGSSKNGKQKGKTTLTGIS